MNYHKAQGFSDLRDPIIPVLPETLAKDRVNSILTDLNECKLPIPSIAVTDEGVFLTWENPYSKVCLSVSDAGIMEFMCENSELDEDGDVISKGVLEGYIDNPKGIGVLMSWLLKAQTKEA